MSRRSAHAVRFQRWSQTLMATLLLAMGLSGLSSFGAGAARGALAQSKHNLSASGAGMVKANATAANAPASEMCVFCHAPHSASHQAALWNHAASSAVYVPYQSSTAKASFGQPTGASRLCLSCHDGTVALGMLKNRGGSVSFQGGVTVLPKSRSNLGTDLSDDHPISFQYSASLAAKDGSLLPPPRGGPVRLDANNELQCTTCHDPHENTYGKFLVMNNTGGALCLTCHNLNGWATGAHSLSPNRWNRIPPNPWPRTDGQTVAANACENCHSPHNAGGNARLLNSQAEEQNCYPCHNGNVAAKNIQAEFNKASAHPVIQTAGVHDPMEMDLVSAGAKRHVECVDCHDPHAAKAAGKTTPNSVSGALNGVRGINSAGANVSQITHEYELCLRCHGDTGKGPSPVPRQFPA
ncbi:MAG TPA: cytochrome c3 family protein, partial [Verrucomicrobiae bacterium]